jgi:hypothetical protein
MRKSSIVAGRGYGARYIVLHGPIWRVQLKVYDLTGDHIPEHSRQQEPLFVVWRVSASAPPSTPFTGPEGEQMYCGDNPKVALSKATAWYGKPVDPEYLPSNVRSYFENLR